MLRDFPYKHRGHQAVLQVSIVKRRLGTVLLGAISMGRYHCHEGSGKSPASACSCDFSLRPQALYIWILISERGDRDVVWLQQALRSCGGPAVAIHFCSWIPATLDSQVPPGGTAGLRMAALAGVQDPAAVAKNTASIPSCCQSPWPLALPE